MLSAEEFLKEQEASQGPAPSSIRMLEYGWDAAVNTTTALMRLHEQYGENKIPDEVRKKQNDQLDSYLTNNYPDVHKTKYADSALSNIGWLGKQVVDPATLPFLALKMVKPLTGMVIGGTTSAGIAGIHSLDQKGELDPYAIGAATALGVVLGGAAGWMGRAGEKFREKELTQLGLTARQLTREYRDQGLNPARAVEQAMQDLSLDRTGYTSAIEAAKKRLLEESAVKLAKLPANLPPSQLQSIVKAEFIARTPQEASKVLWDKAYRFQEELFKTNKIQEYLGTTYGMLEKLWPRGAGQLRRFEQFSKEKFDYFYKKANTWSKAWRKVPTKNKSTLAMHLYNGDAVAFGNEATRIGRQDLISEFGNVRAAFDELYVMAKDAGYDVPFLKEYFPRFIKDFEGFSERRGINTYWKDKLAQDLHKIRTGQGYASSMEEQLAMRKIITAPKVEPYRLGPTSNLQERTIDQLVPEDMKFMSDPVEAMNRYFHDVVHAYERRKFFGFGDPKNMPKYKQDLESSIEGLLVQELKGGFVRSRDVREIRDILHSRFGPGEKSPHAWNQRIKNVFYGATLGNPISAFTQLADIGTSMAINGVIRTLRALLPGRIKMEQIGIHRLYEELGSPTRTSRWLDNLLAASGFNALDKFGKNTFITAAMRRLSSQVKSEKGIRSFVNKYRNLLTPTEMADAIKSFKNKQVTETSKMVLFSELSDIQPISMAELPKKYLQNPNGRMFYMLKTFTLRQLSMIARKTVGEIRRGNPQGLPNAIKLGTILVSANTGIDFVKNLFAGKDTDLTDVAFSSLLRTFALSQYVAQRAKEGRVAEAAGLLLTPPPLTVTGDSLESIFSWLGDDPNLRILRYVPFGRVLYDLAVPEEMKR